MKNSQTPNQPLKNQQPPLKKKRPSKSRLANVRLTLLYLLPVSLFFSYYPRIPLPFASDSTNFELSLPLILLFIFSILSLSDFFKKLTSSIHDLKSKSSKTPLLLLLSLFFPTYLSLTILWSKNPVRAILTSGIVWCLYISIFSIISISKTSKNFKSSCLIKSFLFGATIACVFCWLQCFLDILGVSRELTLLCQGCTSRIFGFPHPSGFAIEPQFMGNLLLAPSLFSIFLLFSNRKSTLLDRKLLLFLSILFISTLFLTFSRGAIYSFVFALLFFVIANILKSNKRALLSLPLVVACFLLSLLAQGLFSAASYTNDTFLSGIEKSISQLSLGLLEPNFSASRTSLEISTSEETLDDSLEGNNSAEDPGDNLSVFSGYVEESTDIRVGLNEQALELSASSSNSLFFGFGLGSAGTVLFEEGKTASKKEIIQNEYFSLLLETGLTGLLLALLTYLVVAKLIKTSTSVFERIFLYTLFIASIASLNFFSGLPNALHIYLFPAILFVYLL